MKKINKSKKEKKSKNNNYKKTQYNLENPINLQLFRKRERVTRGKKDHISVISRLEILTKTRTISDQLQQHKDK